MLAKKVLNLNVSTLQCMDSNRNLIIKNLLDGNPILVPYDTDANHEPCLRNGKKAHWCIANGVAMRINKDKFNSLINDDDLMNRSIIDLKNLKSDDRIKLINESLDLHLFCKQGKSMHLKLFPFDRLVESNKNLFEVDDSKQTSDFNIPNEGIKNSLCDQFLLITK